MKCSHVSAWENSMKFVDTHAHILSDEFEEDFDAMLERCAAAHVDRMMIITLSNEETRRAIALKKTDPYRFQIAAGIFPEDVTKVDEAYWEEFVSLVQDPLVDCIGEIGLDYYWEKDPDVRALQREFFIRQIELARQVNKPIAVHSRDAIQDTFDIMKEHHWKVLMHCYSGTKEMAREFTKLGYYIALGGPVTFKNARHSVEVAASVDEKYLLSETDCPYLSPVPYRGKRNEPARIPLIVAKLAETRGVSVEEMAAVIDANWTRFLEQCR